jgi:glycosyltransferase involved in cell wall biosynthesis
MEGLPVRVVLLSHNAQAGDAIGNQLAEKLGFFLERGAGVRVFVETIQRLHPAVRPYVSCLAEAKADGEAWEFLCSADLIIVEYGHAYALLGLLPLLAGGKPRILFDYHGITPLGLCDRHNREGIERGTHRRGLVWCADGAIAHSRFTSLELRKHTGFPESWVHLLGHPIDTRRFSPGDPKRDLRAEFQIGDASLAMYVGRLAPNKRVPVLIDALAQLQALSPAIDLLIVGDASDVYREEADRCLRLASDLGIANRVHLLGQLDEDGLLDAYRSADVFVMPSVHEGFCIPVAEAMACGVPVIAARAGALPETVGSSGLTFVPDDATDLARQMRRVLGAKEEGTEDRGQRTEDRGQRTEDRRQRTEDRRQRTEDRGQRTEDRGQRTEDRGQRTEDRGQRTEGRKEKPGVIIRRAKNEEWRMENEGRMPRVAVVAFRYGEDFVGGAERSLRTIAETLRENGCQVEVFCTCTKSENEWANDLPEGSDTTGRIPIHRLRLDPHDRARHYEVVRTILEKNGDLPAETESEYLSQSIHSTRLLNALARRANEFDAILVGPYLYGLSHDVCQSFPDKAVLVACFHDEPFARLRIWRPIYEQVAGIWYHSPEEQGFAETELGINHPYALCIGTVLDVNARGDADRGRRLVGGERRYVVYCGRYSRQKNVPLLIDYARRYHKLRAERFTFVFVGHGEVPIPREEWSRDLGYVAEGAKRDILAGASALLQLSQHESLSLVALEAWTEAIPVIAHECCDVLMGHIRRSGGGQTIRDFDSFAAALDDLWLAPERWQAMGADGGAYARLTYGNPSTFAENLLSGIHELRSPLHEQMRRRGLARAAELDRALWRKRFGDFLEDFLHAPRRQYRRAVEIEPRGRQRTVTQGTESTLAPIRVSNQGTVAMVPDGPGRVVLRAELVDTADQPCAVPAVDTELPALLMPGHTLAVAVRIPVPKVAGAFRVRLSCLLDGRDIESSASLDLLVKGGGGAADKSLSAELLQLVQAAIGDADRQQRLPDDYLDVTEGFLAEYKRRIKRKLLGNFKRSYVDVLSRQQSAFNRSILRAVQELAECLAVLDHADGAGRRAAPDHDLRFLADQVHKAVNSGKADEIAMLIRDLLAQLAESQRNQLRLAERLANVERLVNEMQRS